MCIVLYAHTVHVYTMCEYETTTPYLSVCLPSPVEWGGGWARAGAAAAGGAGLAATALLAAVLWRHRATPVVKSASRELCALQLAAAALCHW